VVGNPVKSNRGTERPGKIGQVLVNEAQEGAREGAQARDIWERERRGFADASLLMAKQEERKSQGEQRAARR